MKSSKLSREECVAAIEAFARRVRRFGETSDAGMFRAPDGGDLPKEQINVQLAIEGTYGTADDFYEALRVLGGHRLPRRDVEDLRESADS